MAEETDFQRARRLADYSDILICVCCMFQHANGEIVCDPLDQDESSDCQHSRGFAKAMANGKHTLTLGMTTDACGHDLADDEDSEAHSEGCEKYGFSWSSCDLCGVNEGGDRYAATLWPVYRKRKRKGI